MKKLYIDMDGTLAEFRLATAFDELFEKGYFLNLKPLENAVSGIKEFIKRNPEVEIFILSSVLRESKFAHDEKNKWLDNYLPEIDEKHRLFPECGESKSKYVFEITENDFLLDDYSVNLHDWKDAGGSAIKLMNGINGTNGSFTGARLSKDLSVDDFAIELMQLMEIR